MEKSPPYNKRVKTKNKKDKASSEDISWAFDSSLEQVYFETQHALPLKEANKVMMERREAEARAKAEREKNRRLPADTMVLSWAGGKHLAFGHPSSSGFIVFKGSSYYGREAPDCPQRIHQMRANLEGIGKLEDGIFQISIYFHDALEAASCILGRAVTDPHCWHKK